MMSLFFYCIKLYSFERINKKDFNNIMFEKNEIANIEYPSIFSELLNCHIIFNIEKHLDSLNDVEDLK